MLKALILLIIFLLNNLYSDISINNYIDNDKRIRNMAFFGPFLNKFDPDSLLNSVSDIQLDKNSVLEVSKEKKSMQQFFNVLRDFPKKTTYGEKETLKALEMAAVDILLISEIIPENKIFELEENAQTSGAEVKIISTETREGAQLRDLGGIAAILRFEIE